MVTHRNRLAKSYIEKVKKMTATAWLYHDEIEQMKWKEKATTLWKPSEIIEEKWNQNFLQRPYNQENQSKKNRNHRRKSHPPSSYQEELRWKRQKSYLENQSHRNRNVSHLREKIEKGRLRYEIERRKMLSIRKWKSIISSHHGIIGSSEMKKMKIIEKW